MTGLLRAEIRRLTSRRLARVIALVFLGIVLLTQVVGAIRSKPADPALQAKTRQQCEAFREQEQDPSGVDCEEAVQAADTRYRAEDVLPEMAGGVTGGAAMAAFIVGAGFVGAEWAAGTMQALLFWEPRRGRVLFAKGAALVGVLLTFTVVMHVVGYGTTMLIGATRGTTEGVTSGLQQSAMLTALRGLAVVAFTGLLGFAVAGLARHTGAALGAGFGYFAVLEQVVGGLRPGWIRYLVGPNIGAVVAKDIQIPSGRRVTSGDLTTEFEFLLTWQRGLVTLAVFLAIVLGAFYVTFTRRDVT